jgi:uncharacterized membrane protein
MTTEIESQDYSPRVLRLVGLSGWILFAIWAAVLIACAIIQPKPYAGAWILVLELAFVGSAMNLLHGASENYHPLYLLFQSGVQDTVLVLVAYPWLVAGYERVAHWPVLGKAIRNIHETARARRDVIEPYGIIGLWFFVFLPLWSTGPLVGCAIGHLIGMRVKMVLASVISGHIFSMIAMIWFFDWLASSTALVSETLVARLPWIVLGIIAAIVTGIHVWKKAARRHRADGVSGADDGGVEKE